jgi:hypothetical protein
VPAPSAKRDALVKSPLSPVPVSIVPEPSSRVPFHVALALAAIVHVLVLGVAVWSVAQGAHRPSPYGRARDGGAGVDRAVPASGLAQPNRDRSMSSSLSSLCRRSS